MKLTLREFSLRLRHPFTISRSTTTVQRTLIVELEQDEQHGYGESIHYPFYGQTIESMTAAIESVRPLIEETKLQDPAALWKALQPALKDHSFAHAAIDLAAHDLWGKLHGKPVYELWGLDIDNNPPTDYTIGIDTIENMVAKMAEFPDWPIYKIKLGTPDDLQIIRELRRHTAAIFRVDANCAWTVEQTLELAPELKSLGVQFIEQPLPRDDDDKMPRLFRECLLPLIADESCIHESDVAACVGRFHGVNIKLCKCAGLTPARRMIGQARRHGLKVMVGCMTETSVGISAIAQLLPLLDFVDMDGALLLAEDVARGVTIEKGRVIYPYTPGCGLTLLP